jgi:type IV pilus assembly protein PilW
VQRGLTLVELMVAMIIGLGTTLAITTLLIAGENHKRTTTSTNDAEQTGAYAFYALDRALRGAGSGFAESAYGSDRGVLGCKLSVAANATSILPRATAFPAPFGSTAFLANSANLRVAPLLIAKNQSQSAANSDVLVVMGGSGAAGGVSRQVTGSGTGTTLILDNTVGFSVGDLALVSQSNITDCLIEQVASIASPTLTLGGTYYTSTGATTTLATLSSSTSTYVTPVGNAGANNLQFTMFGVGANRTLYSYDLLQNLDYVLGSGTDTAQAIAEGVDQIHAIYGLDTNGDGVRDAWADPAATGYDMGTVMITPGTMRQIIAVRVALVLRSEYYDKNTVSPASLTWFAGLTNGAGNSIQQTVTLSADDQHYRYRVFEFTVPLRNMLLLAGGP